MWIVVASIAGQFVLMFVLILFHKVKTHKPFKINAFNCGQVFQLSNWIGDAILQNNDLHDSYQSVYLEGHPGETLDNGSLTATSSTEVVHSFWCINSRHAVEWNHIFLTEPSAYHSIVEHWQMSNFVLAKLSNLSLG